MTTWGIIGIGFVFGYLLYYAVRHTPNFNVSMLSTTLGALGVGWITQLKDPDSIGPYGVGIFLGFMTYLLLALVLSLFGIASQNAVGVGFTAGVRNVAAQLRTTLLGSP